MRELYYYFFTFSLKNKNKTRKISRRGGYQKLSEVSNMKEGARQEELMLSDVTMQRREIILAI